MLGLHLVLVTMGGIQLERSKTNRFGLKCDNIT